MKLSIILLAIALLSVGSVAAQNPDGRPSVEFQAYHETTGYNARIDRGSPLSLQIADESLRLWGFEAKFIQPVSERLSLTAQTSFIPSRIVGSYLSLNGLVDERASRFKLGLGFKLYL